MSASEKPRGQSLGKPPSELTRLKILWRDSLAESARDFWQSLFASDTTQAEVRRQLKAKLQINLTRDNQLTDFRSWLEEQAARDQEAERQQDDELRLAKDHPDWDADRLRSEVIAASYRRTLATGDFALGLKTVRQDLNVKQVTLDREKFTAALKTKLETALDELANEFRANPEAMELYAKARAMIARETV